MLFLALVVLVVLASLPRKQLQRRRGVNLRTDSVTALWSAAVWIVGSVAIAGGFLVTGSTPEALAFIVMGWAVAASWFVRYASLRRHGVKRKADLAQNLFGAVAFGLASLAYAVLLLRAEETWAAALIMVVCVPGSVYTGVRCARELREVG
jgi:hypothetical protein